MPTQTTEESAAAQPPPQADSLGERRGSTDRRQNDRRTGEDRRSGVDRRSGLDRRRGPGIRRSEDRRLAEEGQMSDDQFEFLMAVEEYKRINQRPFPTWTEILEIVKLLGYRKVAPRASSINELES